MRIVFVGGGTGGHFYPLMAVAGAVRAHPQGTNAQMYYFGPEPYNAIALAEHTITFVHCPAGKRRRYRSWRNVLDLFKIGIGIVVAFWKLLRLYPDVVMSKGGYTSLPVVTAAWLLRIPIVIHESDAVPGRANTYAARFARYIAIAHDDVAPYFPADKIALIGMPIRKSFFTANPNAATDLGITTAKPIILFTGGSLGAQRVNDLVIESLETLLQKYTVIHQTGPDHLTSTQEAVTSLIDNAAALEDYYALETMDATQFANALQAASLVVSRAGSGTIFEIALKQKPSILIPIPEDISHDQRSNAYAYAQSGAASVLEERNLSANLLQSEVERILGNTETYQQMQQAAATFTKSDAAEKLAKTLVDIAAEHA